MRAMLPTMICLLLSLLGGGVARGAQPTSAANASPAVPAAALAAAAIPSGGATADGDAAAKHTKRTACLKSAKAKKLVGAQKTAFIKECVGPPGMPAAAGISAAP